MADETDFAHLDEILSRVTALQEKQALLIEKQSKRIELLTDAVKEITINLQKFDANIEKRIDNKPNAAQIGIATGSEHHNHFRSSQLQVSRFFGDNPSAWISQIQRYFDFYDIPDHRRLSIASYYLDGNALDWYEWMSCNELKFCWKEFLVELERRFGLSGPNFCNIGKVFEENTRGDRGETGDRYEYSAYELDEKKSGDDFHKAPNVVQEKPTEFLFCGWGDSFKSETDNPIHSKTSDSVSMGAELVSNYNKDQIFLEEDASGFIEAPTLSVQYSDTSIDYGNYIKISDWNSRTGRKLIGMVTNTQVFPFTFTKTPGLLPQLVGEWKGLLAGYFKQDVEDEGGLMVVGLFHRYCGRKTLHDGFMRFIENILVPFAEFDGQEYVPIFQLQAVSLANQAASILLIIRNYPKIETQKKFIGGSLKYWFSGTGCRWKKFITSIFLSFRLLLQLSP